MFKKARARIEQELRGRLGDDRVVALEDGANFFGVESKGKAQIRGNGVLAATQDEILFVMWFPRKEIRVRRDRVTALERTRWHLGKSVGRELLRVRFTNDAGQPDSVAWWVRDLAGWERVLRSAGN
ncbi:MAG TPA: hypothetical protein VIG64_07425 [Actinomycetota bacterium]|jgi:hypothetical protein